MDLGFRYLTTFKTCQGTVAKTLGVILKVEAKTVCLFLEGAGRGYLKKGCVTCSNRYVPYRFAHVVARAQGVGPKLAGRIVNELKEKAGGLAGMGGGAASAVPLPQGSASADAVSALENLGFKPAVASAAVAHAMGELGDGAPLNDLVRLALRKAAG